MFASSGNWRFQQALLFVNKKKQKNFDLLRAVATPTPMPPRIKSFLLLFFKKEVLSYPSNVSVFKETASVIAIPL
jgi:hypothetical protein